MNNGKEGLVYENPYYAETISEVLVKIGDAQVEGQQLTDEQRKSLILRGIYNSPSVASLLRYRSGTTSEKTRNAVLISERVSLPRKKRPSLGLMLFGPVTLVAALGIGALATRNVSQNQVDNAPGVSRRATPTLVPTVQEEQQHKAWMPFNGIVKR